MVRPPPSHFSVEMPPNAVHHISRFDSFPERNSTFDSPDHVQLVILNNEPLFFAARDGPWFPTLRILHKYPLMMNCLRVDTGAIKFVLSGANIMCPGLTSPGATIHIEVTCRSNQPPSPSQII